MGIRFVVCSGRIYAGARIYAREIGIIEPIIACNGAIIKNMHTGELLYSNSLGKEDCFRIVDICHEKDVYFHVYIGDAMYTEQLGFSSLFYWKRNQELPEKDRVDIRLVENIKQVIEESPVQASKIVVVSEDYDLLQETRRRVDDIATVDVMSSDRNNFEAMNRGVNKGHALKHLADLLGIKREEIIAIGDNENDYTMLEYAGLGIAMGNANKEIKEIAGYISTSNDEDGVAEALYRFIL